MCHPATTSVDHNVITNATGILTVSSNKKKESLPPAIINQAEVFECDLCYETVMLEEVERVETEPYERHMCAYIALCVEEKFIEFTNQNKYKCTKCSDLLMSMNDKINDELLVMKEKQQPSASTLKIVIFSNAVNRLYSTNREQRNSFIVVWNTIFKNLDISDLYDGVDFTGHEQDDSSAFNHKEAFIKLVIKTFMILKSQKICKKETDREKGELVRYNKKRDYILLGQ